MLGVRGCSGLPPGDFPRVVEKNPARNVSRRLRNAAGLSNSRISSGLIQAALKDARLFTESTDKAYPKYGPGSLRRKRISRLGLPRVEAPTLARVTSGPRTTSSR